MDIFTTLMNIAKANLPESRKIDGTNVYSLLKGEEYFSSEPFFYFKGTTLQAVRKGKWKLRLTQSSGYELYDLEVDPSEMYDVAEENQQLVDDLFQLMLNFSNETKAKIDSIEN
jgi:arylsulfatase A-like enzyme